MNINLNHAGRIGGASEVIKEAKQEIQKAGLMINIGKMKLKNR